MREKPGLWHCNCRTLLGPYQLNSAHLNRCLVCGVARHSDPTVAANVKLAPHSPASPLMIRTAGDADARVSHDVGRSPRQRHAPLPAVAADDGPSIHRWENEGGSYSMTDELDVEVDGCEEPPAGLESYAFLSRYFPDRRRHDLEALKAYEAYRSPTVAPSSSHRGRTSITVVGRVPIASVS